MSSKKVKKAVKLSNEDKKTFSWGILVGGFLIILALLIPIRTFSPVLTAELAYRLKTDESLLVPVDSQFSIVIPKIGANTKIIKNVDPFNSKEYQQALTSGVAHAKNSATPDKNGNTFIFAHSAGNWYQANQYNAVFYLLNKLTKGDEIIVYYQDKPYTYLVKEIKYVNQNEISYLASKSDQNQLTLMTCWPPGTTLKRLLIIADLKNDNQSNPPKTN